MNTKLATIALTALAITSQNLKAATVTINFDTFPNNATVPANTIITNQYSAFGVIFSSTAPAGGPIAGVLTGENGSPPNFAYGFDPISGAGLYSIVMDFTSPIAALSLSLISVGESTVTATAFSSDLSTQLDTISVSHPGSGVGFGNVDPIALDGPAISRVRVQITQLVSGDGFGIDDVVINTIPEPSSGLLLLSGAAFSFRRRSPRAKKESD